VTAIAVGRQRRFYNLLREETNRMRLEAAVTDLHTLVALLNEIADEAQAAPFEQAEELADAMKDIGIDAAIKRVVARLTIEDDVVDAPIKAPVSAPAASGTPGNPIVAQFMAGWEKKFGERYDLTPADAGTLKNLQKTHGDKTPRIVDAFFQSNVQWFDETKFSVQSLWSRRVRLLDGPILEGKKRTNVRELDVNAKFRDPNFKPVNISRKAVQP
jgi:hypothetical protein